MHVLYIQWIYNREKPQKEERVNLVNLSNEYEKIEKLCEIKLFYYWYDFLKRKKHFPVKLWKLTPTGDNESEKTF